MTLSTSSILRPDNMIIGVRTLCPRSSRQISRPPRAGSTMSRAIRSAIPCNPRSSPSRPCPVETTEKPSSSKATVRVRRRASSSSMSRIFFMGVFLRKNDPERAPPGGSALGPDRCMVGIHDVLDDLQAEPDSLRVDPDRLGGPIEFIKDSVRMPGSDADSPVIHLDLDFARSGRDLDLDLLVLRRILHGVVDEVDQGLLDGVPVDGQEYCVLGERQFQPETGLLNPGAQNIDRLFDQRPEFGPLKVIRFGLPLDFPIIQDVVDQPGNSAALRGQESEEFLPLGPDLDPSPLQELGQPFDGAQGGPQLMGYRRDEFRLEAVELVEFLFGSPLINHLFLKLERLQAQGELAGQGGEEVEVVSGIFLARFLLPEHRKPGQGGRLERQRQEDFGRDPRQEIFTGKK